MNTYTVEDVKVLENMYRKAGFSISANILSSSDFKLPTKLSNFWYTIQSDFLFSTPFQRIPMYVHESELVFLIEWRLRIGK